MNSEAISNMSKCCAFTGHRPKSFPWKYDESSPGCILLKEALTIQIMVLAGRGVTDWFSGMALGTDLWCAQIVLDLQKTNPALNLCCVLPCEEQADGWSDSAREQYYSILEQATSVEYVSRAYHAGCMIKRNHRLVESAGLLLAVYNGAKRSGTGATVNYARKLGREIILIDPITRHITHEGITQPHDETTMPPELRKAHQDNDRAVMGYGFWGKLNSESACVAELIKMYPELTEKQ